MARLQLTARPSPADNSVITRTHLNYNNDVHSTVAEIEDPTARLAMNRVMQLKTLHLLHYIHTTVGKTDWSVANDEGYNTPAGRYVITDKHRSWTSTLYHCSMPFFMRLNCSAIGLHSGYVTGRPASHGCIRLPYEKAQKFFGICRVGDEVQIVH